jgi:putative peptidoglycan binding protein
MKLNKSLLTAVIVGSSLGMAPGLVQADGDKWRYDEPRAERGFEPRAGDDSSLPPHIGDSDYEMMTESDALKLEKALVQRGYDPGAVDGVIDKDTRAAIQKFQDDHQLAATGIIDHKTGELLGAVVFESS